VKHIENALVTDRQKERKIWVCLCV